MTLMTLKGHFRHLQDQYLENTASIAYKTIYATPIARATSTAGSNGSTRSFAVKYKLS